MSDEKPAFTEGDVADDFVNAIDAATVGELGHGFHLRRYEWVGDSEDDEGEWPFVVVRDGREFEVDIDVRVTELTPERKAKRAEEEQRVLALLQARGVKPVERS